MSMKRVIVIEDDVETCKTYANALKKSDFDVNMAFDLKDALQGIEEKTYHVAVVDLGLQGQNNIENVSGLEVLDRLKKLGEGTVVVVISGQLKPQISADSIQKHGALRYITKDEIFEGGREQLINEVIFAFEKSKLILFGSFENVINFIIQDKNATEFIDKCLRNLQPKEGYKGLQHFLENVISPLCPLIPELEMKSLLEFSKNEKILSGTCWSKAIGKSVEICIFNKNENPEIYLRSDKTKFMEEHLIFQYKKFNLVGWVAENPFKTRNDFPKIL